MKHETLGNVSAEPVQAQNQGASALVGTVPRPKRYEETTTLKRGDQARMMAAAAFSIELGTPIDTLLTINAAHLQRVGKGGVFATSHLWVGLQKLLELLRKWIVDRGEPWACMWVREWSSRGHKGNGQSGEHWHIAFHLPKRYRSALATQVAEWTGENIGDITEKEIISAGRAWHIEWRQRSRRGGPENIAAYLGKAEPNWIKKYGKRVENPDKRVRNYGGTGPVEGKRFYICQSLGSTAQAKAGYKWHLRRDRSAA